jgi:hypothetical protein
MSEVRVFAFCFEPLYRRVARPFGVSEASTHVAVGHGALQAVFGPWRVESLVTNITDTTVTGPFAVPKTVGPAHLSLKDRGLTFATNRRRGLCIRFQEPVPGMDPAGALRHPALTVTVADVEGLARAIDEERDRVRAAEGRDSAT